MIYPIVIFLFFILCLINKDIMYSSSIQTVNNFIKHTFPTLFMPFVLFDLLNDSKLSKHISNFFHPVLKFLFNFKYKESSYIFFMSFLCGTPSNAKLIDDHYNLNLIDYEEANHLIKFNNFISPFFLISIINLIFDNLKIKCFFIIAHYLPRIIMGVILGRFYKHQNYNNKTITKPELNLFEKFNNSISKTMSILIWVLGFSTFFTILINIFFLYVNLEYSQDLLFNLVYEHNFGIVLALNSFYTNQYIGKIILIFTSLLSFTTIIEIKIMFKKTKLLPFLYSNILLSILSLLLFHFLLVLC